MDGLGCQYLITVLYLLSCLSLHLNECPCFQILQKQSYPQPVSPLSPSKIMLCMALRHLHVNSHFTILLADKLAIHRIQRATANGTELGWMQHSLLTQRPTTSTLKGTGFLTGSPARLRGEKGGRRANTETFFLPEHPRLIPKTPRLLLFRTPTLLLKLVQNIQVTRQLTQGLMLLR